MSENLDANGGVAAQEDIWCQLREHALEAMTHAYAPYSGYPVGAAALVDDGRIVCGCNVENASTGLGLCAECGLVGALMLGGGGRLVKFVAVNGNQEVVVPCGRCRQLLYEHGGKTLEVLMPERLMTMDEVMPFGFGPEELAQVPGAINIVGAVASRAQVEAEKADERGN